LRAAAVDAAGALLGVSCPRGGVTVFWDLARAFVIAAVELPAGCGLASADAPGTFLLTSGRGGVRRIELRERRITPLPATFVGSARWDNHLALGRLAS
jgi:hypothetical protein